MLTVALTGGIATGKSVVASVLADLGCYVHSADEVARELMEPGGAAHRKVAARFGAAVLAPDGTIDRARLGALVFGDAAARAAVNAIVHPLVLAKKKEVITALAREGRTAVYVSEAALTIEAGFQDFFDVVVVTTCRPEIQLRRLMERDGIGEEEALRKIGSQMSAAEKASHGDHVIDTSGSLAETVERTEEVWRTLLQASALKAEAKSGGRRPKTGSGSRAARRSKSRGPSPRRDGGRRSGRAGSGAGSRRRRS
ncbi:MAG: dephospho-CoA kinase [Candidatus Aminicenantes bacterium]|nr:dephospho-CoA kinase [Candidatus Aminicenantes bacterium]